MFSGRPRLTSWRASASEAITESRRTGRPLVIFFTSRFSVTASQLEQTLANLPELASTTEQKFVLLRIDYSEKAVLESAYYTALRNRYKPGGFPVLVAAMPDGKELTRQSGFNSAWASRTSQWFKSIPDRAKSATEMHRRELEKQGFRVWNDRSGSPIFARLEKVDANQLTFTGEWGEPFRTFTNRLSDADQQFIAKKSS